VAAVCSTAAHAGTLPNNFPILNHAGAAATFSTDGFVDLDNEFHSRVGANGRTCESCHLPHAGWSIRPIDVELLFLLTRGNDPIFNLLDANSPQADVSTVQARYRSYSMLRRGLFRRGGNLPVDAEFEIESVVDPLQTGASTTRFEFFRRPLATANFHIAKNIGWHDQNTNGSGDVTAGLITQATGAINGALGGPPAASEVVQSIVRYEATLSFAQQSIFGVGRLDSCGAQGGAENLSSQPAVAGRFTLFDAWIGIVPGSCTTKNADRKRAQIARGQEIFNSPNRGGGSCLGCHNASNNGSHANGVLFDIGASRPAFALAGMPVYSLRNKVTGETRQTTDPGRAVRSGRWADVDKFKVPSLRGLAARPPYFHNGIAPTLKDVVIHYEVARGFQFTPQEREDLVAFMEAL
jgi:cytochrome c peroxidase